MKSPKNIFPTLSFTAHSAKPKAWKTHMYMEWFIVLFLSSILLIGIALWSSYLYGNILNRLSSGDGTSLQDSLLSVDRNSLTATLQHFESKKAQFDALGVARPTYADPSR